MNSKQLQEYRDKLAKDFCKDWPTEQYHHNDLTLFYEKGFDAAVAILQKEIYFLEKELEGVRALKDAKDFVSEGKLQAEQARSLKLLEALKKINEEELNGQRPGGSHGRSATLSYEAIQEYQGEK